MFRQTILTPKSTSFQPAENKLREQAIFNSFCFKKLQRLKLTIRKLLEKIEIYKKDQHELAEELSHTNIKIDALEMLNKTEDALKYDIKQLIHERNRLIQIVARLETKLNKLRQ